MRTLITYLPFADLDQGQEWHLRGFWPCRWIHHDEAGAARPLVIAYRKPFCLEQDVVVRAHVSADERYELYLDGRLIGRGSEYGDAANWYYETYDLPLMAGPHVIVAKVWSLGAMAPYAQMSVRHGFIFAPEGEYQVQLGTGVCDWQSKRIEGLDFIDPTPAFGTGANLVVEGARYPWGIEHGLGDGWAPAVVGQPGTNGRFRNNIEPSHLMRPAVLPPMIDREVHAGIVRFVSEPEQMNRLHERAIRAVDAMPEEPDRWGRVIVGDASISVPPRTRRRVIIDLQGYYCAYPQLTVSGGKGSAISLTWAESLFNEPTARTKGNRDEIEEKFFSGVGDTFKPDGGAHRAFRTLWWQAGRYLQLGVETADEPLVIEQLNLRETRYPLEMESSFRCDDAELEEIVPLAFRSLQMCAHETYIDCPYYEQLMYSGDSRLKGLTTMVSTRDAPLLRKAIEVFDYSRTFSGFTQARYPSRLRQAIVPFSLFWIGMVHDHALWRGDKQFVRRHMPGVRAVLEGILGLKNEQGLIACPDGWNFLDWVPTWTDGVHPGMEYGPSGIFNLQSVYTLQLAAKLEEWLAEPEMTYRWSRAASELVERITATFWDERRGLFADDVRKVYLSEHAQCFAVLSELLPRERQDRIKESLGNERDMVRTTISFNHYLFETYGRLGLTDLFYERLNLWRKLRTQGFRTTPEQPEPSRSDCHGWASHPIYHFFATVLGIRPGAMGFGSVEISPELGPLKHAAGRMVHPKGAVEVDVRIDGGHLKASVALPRGIDGRIHFGGVTKPLTGGQKQFVSIAQAERPRPFPVG